MILSWNQTLEKWTRIDRNDAVGTSLLNHFPILKDKRFATRIRQVFTNGAPVVFSPALHGHFLPVVIGPGVPPRLMIQSTEVRRIATDPALAVVSIIDVTQGWEQVFRLSDQRHKLEELNESLVGAKADAILANRCKGDFLA